MTDCSGRSPGRTRPRVEAYSKGDARQSASAAPLTFFLPPPAPLPPRPAPARGPPWVQESALTPTGATPGATSLNAGLPRPGGTGRAGTRAAGRASGR